MIIKEIHSNKKEYLNILLIGDEDEDMIEENKTVFNFIKIKTKKQSPQNEKKNDKLSK